MINAYTVTEDQMSGSGGCFGTIDIHYFSTVEECLQTPAKQGRRIVDPQGKELYVADSGLEEWEPTIQQSAKPMTPTPATIKIDISPNLLKLLPTQFGIEIIKEDGYGQVQIGVFNNQDIELFDGYGDTLEEALWSLEQHADKWMKDMMEAP